MKIYACGTERSNKKGLPAEVKKPPQMVWGEHRSFQEPNSNLVATVWHDNRPVRVFSTNSRTDVTIPIERKCRNTTIAVDQPENVYIYNKYMNRVDKHDQHRMNYSLGWFSVKYWKYLLWFLVNSCVVNAYILYEKRSTRQTKKNYRHLDFQI